MFIDDNDPFRKFERSEMLRFRSARKNGWLPRYNRHHAANAALRLALFNLPILLPKFRNLTHDKLANRLVRAHVIFLRHKL